ncbi:LOW QUALITY PROTEIN: hypothetical protein CFOL_v3_34405, partial [Cephalotus follicularis]
QNQEKYLPSSSSRSSMDLDMDCKAVADAAVSKFKRVISLLGRTRIGHARFRRAPMSFSSSFNQTLEDIQTQKAKVYYATPIREIPPVSHKRHDFPMLVPKYGVVERRDSSTAIKFSYFGGNSFMSSLTGDTHESKQPSSSSAFQITKISHASSAGKPPLSSNPLKRKCSSKTLGSGKCSGSSSSCRVVFSILCVKPERR